MKLFEINSSLSQDTRKEDFCLVKECISWKEMLTFLGFGRDETEVLEAVLD